MGEEEWDRKTRGNLVKSVIALGLFMLLGVFGTIWVLRTEDFSLTDSSGSWLLSLPLVTFFIALEGLLRFIDWWRTPGNELQRFHFDFLAPIPGKKTVLARWTRRVHGLAFLSAFAVWYFPILAAAYRLALSPVFWENGFLSDALTDLLINLIFCIYLLWFWRRKKLLRLRKKVMALSAVACLVLGLAGFPVYVKAYLPLSTQLAVARDFGRQLPAERQLTRQILLNPGDEENLRHFYQTYQLTAPDQKFVSNYALSADDMKFFGAWASQAGYSQTKWRRLLTLPCRVEAGRGAWLYLFYDRHSQKMHALEILS